MIFTFYSYKGGVGRSMAVANVARSFANHGLRVVMVDWDLEAPGLESFFYDSDQELLAARSELGLIDLLTTYKRDFQSLRLPDGDLQSVAASLTEVLAPLASSLIRVDASSDRLWLLPAGWRAGDRFADYASAVQEFNWGDFYASFAGEAYFEWFRTQLLDPAVADVVLIDSRTGVTEMGGVCTRQLADVVVAFCVPNVQNLAGVTEMAASFKREEVLAHRGRPLDIVIVPTRIDASEIDRRNRFEGQFETAAGRFTPLPFRNFGRRFWDLKLPYVSKYAYEETLAVGQSDSAEELEAAYQGLAAHLALLAPEGARRLREPWERFWRSQSKPPTAGAISPVFIVPVSANRRFTDRAELMAAVRARLANDRVVALLGIVGIGKTTLATQYVYANSSDYDVVCWIDAREPTSIARNFAALSESLGLSRLGSDDASAVEGVKHWLVRNDRWLLVFDDAAPGVFQEYIPAQFGGHILITSSDPQWGGVAALLRAPPFTREQAVDLLLARTGLTDRAAAGALSEQLGDLPIALELAASYVEASGRSLAATLELAQTPDGDLWDAATSLSIANVRAALTARIADVLASDAEAARLLGVGSFLAPEEIPLDFIFPVGTANQVVDRAVLVLRRHGLAEVREDRLRIHGLIQAVTRDTLGESWQRELVAEAVQVADGALRRAARANVAPVTLGPLIRHALAAVRHDDEVGLKAPADQVTVLMHVSEAQRASSEYAAALATLDRAAAIHADHRASAADELVRIATSRATLLRELGRPRDADDVLSKFVAALPSVPSLQLEFGRVKMALGDPGLAEYFLEAAVLAAERADDPIAAEAHLALGRVLRLRGASERAREALERARDAPVSDPTRRLDGEISVELGRLLLDAGDSVGARAKASQAIFEADRDPHPADRETVLVSSASLLADIGDLELARTTLARALAIIERTRGAASSLFATASAAQGRLDRQTGEYDAAVRHLEAALTIDEEVHGAEHPAVTRDLAELAFIRAILGDDAGATRDFERALRIASRIYPPDDPRLLELTQLGADLDLAGGGSSPNASV